MTNVSPPTRHYPIIRVFVSSTFSDLKHERNELQRTVFRELEEHCLRRRFQFQAIDLRWGVPSEAGLDHRTMRICFEELRRSQQISPQPNFLILLGDRYGWRPLPEEISLAEYQELADTVAAEPDQRTVLEQWYRRDDNAVPPVHVLRSRRDSPDGRNYGRNEATRQDSPAWREVQAALWAIINRAFPPEQLDGRFEPGHLAASSVPSIVRFQTSATEQEIWHGALQAPDATQHVFAFVRKLSNVEQRLDEAQPKQKLGDFVDLRPDGSQDTDSQKAQSQLLEALEKHLGANGYHTVTSDAQLSIDKATDRYVVSRDHVQALCDAVREKLLPVIDQQMKEYWQPTGAVRTATALDDTSPAGSLSPPKLRELELEIAAHARFGDERAPAGIFVGREQETARILNYLRGDDSRPLVVYGPSGSGKTALLAHAARLAEKELSRKPIVRYLGTTAHSGSVRSLLTSLCLELRQKFGVTGEAPAEFRDLVVDFYELLADHAAQPIYLLLDALDQFDDTDDGRQLGWLRASAQQSSPQHVRLVVSCLSDVPDDEPAGLPFRTLSARGLMTSAISLDTLTEAEANKLLFDLWLGPDAASTHGEHRPNRTIAEKSDKQREYLKRCLAQSPAASNCLRPFYLKLLYEEARLWRSFDAPPDRVPATVSDLLRSLFHRLRRNDQHGSVIHHVLGYLSASRYGLAETELLEVLFRDPRYKTHLDRTNTRLGHEFPPGANRIPIALWSRLRYDLQPYLAERGAIGSQVLTFHHRQVAQWVGRRFARLPRTRQAKHQRLAYYFVDSARGPDAAQPFATDSVRGFSEAVFHCVTGEQVERAGALLQDFSFLMGKLRVGLLDAVAGEYELTVKHGLAKLPRQLDVWQTFFRENAHILRRGDGDWPAHKVLLQLAIEHADGSPLTLSAEQWLEAGHCDWLWLRRLWRLPHAERDSCRNVLEGHTGSVGGATALADGRILSWSSDSTLRLWDGATGAPRGVIKGHTDDIEGAMELSNNRILSWSKDRTLRLWDGQSGSPLAVLKGHTSWVTGATSLENGRILSWSFDGTLLLWDGVTGAPRGTLQGHTGRVNGALPLPDGRILSWSADHTLRLWDGQTGAPHGIIEGHTKSVHGAAMLLDGRILSWSSDDCLRMWDGVTGAPRGVLQGHIGSVRGATLLADGRILSWNGGFRVNGTLRLWDGASGAPLAVLEGHTGGVQGATALADGRLLSWSDDNTLRQWDGASGAPLAVLKGHTNLVIGAIELSQGRILSWSYDDTLRLWDGVTGAPRGTLQGHTCRVNGALPLSDGWFLSWTYESTLRLWDGQTVTPRSVREGHTEGILGTLPLADGRILSWSRDKTLRLWDGASGAPLVVLEGHTGSVCGATALADSRILSWSWDKTLRLWDGASGAPLVVLEGHTGSVYGATALADSRILSWSWDKTLRLWDGANGAALAVLKGHTDLVNGATALADGRILSWSYDNTLRLWDGRSGSPLAVLAGHTDRVDGAMAQEDGRILSWSLDDTFRLWDSTTGVPLEVVFNADARTLHPEWWLLFRAMTDGDDLKKVCEPFRIASRSRRNDLLHGRQCSRLASWHAHHDCRSHYLLSDGSAVIVQSEVQVCILKLYHGTHRVTLAKTEAILAPLLKSSESVSN